MSDLGELYQEVIIDHSRSPRNFHELKEANRRADGHNPLCGDQISLYVLLKDNMIQDISFQGTGCAISKASASMMTESVKAKTTAEAAALFEKFHRMVTGEGNGMVNPAGLGKLAAFSGVSEYPVRVKCASLAWHTLRAALEARQATVSTE
ncbi:MAG: SUF system NifU family Fe-S cluster assembly protein [Elusimicrobia bacterium]|nr:SUF system NifU family Fe-S cluster assembly protein [Elusimicrobiota bacterium]